jgi:hypothetical protein
MGTAATPGRERDLGLGVADLKVADRDPSTRAAEDGVIARGARDRTASRRARAMKLASAADAHPRVVDASTIAFSKTSNAAGAVLSGTR